MSDQLKPCPFCASADVEIRTSISDEMVACNICGCRTGIIYLGQSDAMNAAKRRELVAVWNTRTLAHLPTDLSEERAWQVLRETPHDDGCQSLNGGHCDCYKPLRAMQQYAAGLQGALAEIRDMTNKRQLPLTTQINDIARTALGDIQ